MGRLRNKHKDGSTLHQRKDMDNLGKLFLFILHTGRRSNYDQIGSMLRRFLRSRSAASTGCFAPSHSELHTGIPCVPAKEAQDHFSKIAPASEEQQTNELHNDAFCNVFLHANCSTMRWTRLSRRCARSPPRFLPRLAAWKRRRVAPRCIAALAPAECVEQEVPSSSYHGDFFPSLRHRNIHDLLVDAILLEMICATSKLDDVPTTCGMVMSTVRDVLFTTHSERRSTLSTISEKPAAASVCAGDRGTSSVSCTNNKMLTELTDVRTSTLTHPHTPPMRRRWRCHRPLGRDLHLQVEDSKIEWILVQILTQFRSLRTRTGTGRCHVEPLTPGPEPVLDAATRSRLHIAGGLVPPAVGYGQTFHRILYLCKNSLFLLISNSGVS